MKNGIRRLAYPVILLLFLLVSSNNFPAGFLVDLFKKTNATSDIKTDKDDPGRKKGRAASRFRNENQGRGFDNTTSATEQQFITTEGGVLSLNGAKLQIPPGSLQTGKLVSITALPGDSLSRLDPLMVNVTLNDGGFRFLPHGSHFEKEVKIFLPYDERLVPHGYSAEDIKTFFFNDSTGHWEPLKKLLTDQENSKIISVTTHFTDMINAIIRLPEMPLTNNYVPTGFKDLKAADPSEEITTIAQPSAVNTGALLLGYPLKIPKGLHGLQPDLLIQYTSEASNGWLGVGWNLAIPSISTETRWGVPRFKTDVETETYLLNGQQLGSVAHRGVAVSRTAEKQFHLRIENSFSKITRHGDHPDNYWWEVTEKDGKRCFYGGNPWNGLDLSSVLTDASGHIAEWALTEARDLNNNFVRYHYKKISDAGLPGGTVAGYQLYIDKITYTGHGEEEGKYNILFTTDRDLNEPKRKDILINARLGFKQVTADLLRKVEIQYQSRNIRSYELKYTEGAFFKTLLQDIVEYDATGNEFSKHHFGYYDDVRSDGEYRPFGSQQTWQSQNDDVHGNFLNPVTLFSDHASALGGSKSSGFGAGLTVTAGVFDGRLFNKSNTAGASFAYSNYKNEGLLALVDIDGDGLRDKLFKKDGHLFFRPNESGPAGQLRFGSTRSITGLSDFDKGTTRTIDAGIESNFLVFAGVQYSNVKNERSSYFADANNDQLMDVVNQGTVFFNHRDASGNISFNASSSNTPSPIQSLSTVDNTLVTIDSAELHELENNNPLHDVVKIWKAPYQGVVSLSAIAQLVEDTSPDRQGYTSADGVKVTIQHNDTELWQELIPGDDYTPKIPSGVDSINVLAGDRIYFRVQSIYDGAYDQVKWTPVITYRDHAPGLEDANKLPVYQFDANADFLAAADMSIGMPIDGEVQITGVFEKPVTSDDIHIEIIKKSASAEQILWQNDLAWDSVVTNSIAFTQLVDKGDDVYFRVSSSTNVDWTALKWIPRIYYTISNDTAVTQVTNSQGEPIIDFYPVVDYRVFNKSTHPSLPWVSLQAETIEISPTLQFGSNNNQSGDITFSVKKKKTLLAKETIHVNSGTVSGNAPLSVAVNQDDSLYIEYHTRSTDLSNAVTAAKAEITGNNLDSIIDAGVSNYSEESHQFGTMYRNWGQFVYNGNGDRANNPIIESDLVIDSSLADPDSIDLSSATDETDMQNLYNNGNGNNPSDNKFVYMIPSANPGAWKGYDDLTYVTNNIISASRMGDDNLVPVNPAQGTGTGSGATAIKKVAKTQNVNVAVGFFIGGSYSKGTTTQLYDYMDMNGDGYPDLLSKNKVQYTLPFGGLDATAKTQQFNDVESIGHRALGLSAGGTFLSSSAFNTRKQSRGSKAAAAEAEGKASIAISGNFNVNNDSTATAWLDINGDGLPDRVHRGGGVELNLGYSFAPLENWGYVGVSEGNAISYGGGIGIDIGHYSIAAGVSLTRSENNMNKTLRDVNGDGLPDYIVDHPLAVASDSHPLMVSINTGNGFAAPVEWAGATGVNEDISTGESANIAFTACVPITPVTPVAKICFNPFTVVGHGASRQKVELGDLDGDGFPDFLESGSDGDLKIRRSTIGRTNLLKTVNRPMGASFVVDYKRMGNTYDMPNSIWVLDNVKINDGVPGDGIDTMFTSFDYADGFYDRNEREFYGFKSVTENDLNAGSGNTIYRSRVKNYINNNYYEKGLLTSEYLQDSAGHKFTETTYSYALKNIQTGSTLPAGSELSDRAEIFPALVETKMFGYEGQAVAAKSTRMVYNYDEIGNVVSQTDYGDSDPSDDMTTQISYYAVADNYLMNVPRLVTVVNGTGQIFRKQEQDINAATGDVTEVRNFSSPGISSSTDMTYDSYGNVASITRPANADAQRLKYSYEYDQEVNTYVTKVEDSYGYVSSNVYDVRFGRLLAITDINNQKTTYTIDDVGRVLTIKGPLESAASAPFTLSFEYHPAAIVPWAITRHYDPENPGNYIETVTFMDGLGKPLQLKKDGALFTSPSGIDQEVMLVSGKDVYDAFGRSIETYHPITEAKGNEGIYNANRDSIAPTKTIYDILDRPVRKIQPDGSFSLMQFGFGIDRQGNVQFSKLVTDANGIKDETFTNMRGLSTSTRRYLGAGSFIWTSFQYNAVNERIAAVDDKQNATISEYDWLGRRTALDHPDAGRTTFEFDPASLLIKKVTANLRARGKSIRYRYDHERLTKVIYPYHSENNVSFYYGARNDPFNRAGRIKVQEDGSGAQEFFYSSLGQVIKNIRTIVIPYRSRQTYKTQWTYDTWNRLQSMVYPDGEQVEFTYNKGGLLSAMRGMKGQSEYKYIRQLGYDKFESRVYLKYGNGTETFYAYEPDRRRLKHLSAETAANREMMDITYVYDKENNLTDIANDATIPRTNNLIGGSGGNHFEYDELYRLTKSSGHFDVKDHVHHYDLSMKYNTVGDIIEKKQINRWKPNNSPHWHTEDETTYSNDYEYHHDQPHTVVRVGDRYYSYDDNGNQTGWGTYSHHHFRQQRTTRWDEENRISSIEDDGSLVYYNYDADDERVIKYNGGHHHMKINGETIGRNGGADDFTIYVNPWVVIEEGSMIKHFFVENQRVVTKQGERNDHYRIAMEDAGQSADVTINYGSKESNAKKILSGLAEESDIEIPVSKAGEEDQPSDPGNRQDEHERDPVIYYYHPDHLGSSYYITDIRGEVAQHFEYIPFGEIFTEDHQNSETTSYLYNGKEQDDETGLYYFGSRYYDARTSAWQSTDPNKDQYPAWSPYQFTFDNPVNYSDPDGRAPDATVQALSGLGFVRVARDFYEGFTQHISYTFDNKPNRVFWSGGEVAMKTARRFAEKNESITLEMTSEGQRLEKITNVLTELSTKLGEQADFNTKKPGYFGFLSTENFWTQISKGFAAGATGKVTAVLRPSAMRVNNIYERNERPVIIENLKKNAKMTHKEFKIETGDEL